MGIIEGFRLMFIYVTELYLHKQKTKAKNTV
jgi:hypothetical protein